MQLTFRSAGKPIRIEAHEPSSDSAPAILLLHGAGGKVGFWLDRLAPHLLSAGVALYAPHYFDSTGTTYADLATIADGIHFPQWLTTVADALSWVASRPAGAPSPASPRPIALVGVSLGSFLALSFAALNSASPSPEQRRAIRCVIDLSGGLPEPYAHSATSDFPPTLILHGEADTIVSVSHARQLDQLLTQLSVSHETRLLPGEGHWFSSAAQLQLLLSVSSFLGRYLK